MNEILTAPIHIDCGKVGFEKILQAYNCTSYAKSFMKFLWNERC